jgi:hypothetical protein
VEPKRKQRNMCRVWSGNLKARDYLEDLDVNERIILRRILKNRIG